MVGRTIQQNILLSIVVLIEIVRIGEVRICSIQDALGKLLRKPGAETPKVKSSQVLLQRFGSDRGSPAASES